MEFEICRVYDEEVYARSNSGPRYEPGNISERSNLGTLICVKEDASRQKASRDALAQQLKVHQNEEGRCVAVLYGSEEDDDYERAKIGELCGEALTVDGPVIKGMVKGLQLVLG